MLIRQAEHADIDDAVSLMEKSIAANPLGFRAKPSESHRDFILRLINERSNGTGDFLVGIKDGRIVAVGGLDPAGMRMEGCDGPMPEIARLHVDSNWLGKGYGRTLIQQLIKVAEGLGHRRLQLHVTKTQKAAINLYEGMGWKKFHDETFVLSNGQIFPTAFYQYFLNSR